MDGDVSRTAQGSLSSIERSPGVRLIYGIAGGNEQISVAKWQLDNACVTTGDLAYGILVIRTGGGAAVTRRMRGDSVRRRPAVGAVTYASPETVTRWTGEGTSEALHIYLPAVRVCRFAQEELGRASPARIDDFFAEIDPWLQGYAQMLTSEIEIFNPCGDNADALFLAQTEHMLLRHLLTWHCDANTEKNPAQRETANALPGNVLRRVQAYVDAHIADDIHLQDLAAIACMSTGHFLRGFRVAAGTTPYHYVLEQRLQRARSMLRSGPEPVSRIAVECGFKTLSHLSARFHGRFGVSPSRFRAAQRHR